MAARVRAARPCGCGHPSTPRFMRYSTLPPVSAPFSAAAAQFSIAKTVELSRSTKPLFVGLVESDPCPMEAGQANHQIGSGISEGDYAGKFENDWRMEPTRKSVLSPGCQAVFTSPSRH